MSQPKIKFANPPHLNFEDKTIENMANNYNNHMMDVLRGKFAQGPTTEE